MALSSLLNDSIDETLPSAEVLTPASQTAYMDTHTSDIASPTRQTATIPTTDYGSPSSLFSRFSDDILDHEVGPDAIVKNHGVFGTLRTHSNSIKLIIVAAVEYIDSNGILHIQDNDDERPVALEPPSALPMPLDNHLAVLPSTRKHQRSPSAEQVMAENRAKRKAISPRAMNRKASVKPAGSTSSKVTTESYSGPTGVSRSAIAERKKKEAIAAGTFRLDPSKIATFLNHIRLNYDKLATLDPGDLTGRTVIHSKCGNSIRMDGPLRSTKFRRHTNTCTTGESNGAQKISTFFRKVSAKTPSSSTANLSNKSAPTSLPTVPSKPSLVLCRGLRPEHDSRVLTVIERSKAGGRTSIQTIAMNQYGKKFNKLDKKQQDSVRNATTATTTWMSHYDPHLHIRHTNCKRDCDPSSVHLTPNDICDSCAGLLSNQGFQTALNRPKPSDENLKFVNNQYRNKTEAMLYARHTGLKEIMEQAVSISVRIYSV